MKKKNRTPAIAAGLISVAAVVVMAVLLKKK
jgi:hypothetical protein